MHIVMEETLCSYPDFHCIYCFINPHQQRCGINYNQPI